MQSIDDGQFVEIDGLPQWLVLRGADRARPALLLVGGPGAGYAALAPFFAGWETGFTLAHWDQPGAGFTFARTPAEPRSIASLADDGVRVAEHVCARLGARKVAVLGFSAGTIVALHMIRRRPELFSAYVGSGQVVDWARQDSLSYELLLQRARARRDTAMLAELAAIGPPPYADTATDAVKSKHAGAPTPREAVEFTDLLALVGLALRGEPAGAAYLARGLQWPQPFPRSCAAYSALRADIVGFDARRLGSTFGMPMFFVQGTEDVFTVTAEVASYAAELAAPHVALLPVAGAGHSALLLRREVLALLVKHVRPWLG